MLNNYNECSLKIVELSDELERSKKMDTNGSDSKHVFTPRKYRKRTSTSTPTPTGNRKRYITADWRTTERPDTPQLTGKRVYKSQRTAQEVRSRIFGESEPETIIPYSFEEREFTPPS